MGDTIELETTVKELSFHNDLFLQGTFDLSAFEKDEKFTHNFIHILDITEQELISETERKIKFHFQLAIEPEVGEINFDGEFILESASQDKIDELQEKNPHFLRDYLSNFILTYSYYHAEDMATKENIPFPPTDVILQGLGIKK